MTDRELDALVADTRLERQFSCWLRTHGIAPRAEYLFRLRDTLDEIKAAGAVTSPATAAPRQPRTSP